MNQILEQLPKMLPLAVAWAQEQETRILREGVALDDRGLADARAMGVMHPEKIRLLKVMQVPYPADPVLIEAAQKTGLISSYTGGMSFRYGIFIRSDCWADRRLIAHECVHTAQYERLGGIQPFLEKYLFECVTIGYPAAPMEQEAINLARSLAE